MRGLRAQVMSAHPTTGMDNPRVETIWFPFLSRLNHRIHPLFPQNGMSSRAFLTCFGKLPHRKEYQVANEYYWQDLLTFKPELDLLFIQSVEHKDTCCFGSFLRRTQSLRPSWRQRVHGQPRIEASHRTLR
jgi:hypothetical protein